MSGWQVYYWKARKQLVVGDRFGRIVDLFGEYCFTVKYTASRRPTTLVHVCALKDFVPSAEYILESSGRMNERKQLRPRSEKASTRIR